MSSSSRNAPLSFVVLMLMIAIQASAQERKYTLGPRLDLVGGGTNEPNAGAQRRGAFYYEAYPSIEMRAAGERATIDASYTFGLRRNNGESNFDSNSHVGSATLSMSINPQLKFTLSDSFQSTSDLTSVNASRGNVSAAEGFRFLFSPVGTRRSSQTNAATIRAEYAWSGNSDLSLSAAVHTRNYANDASFQGSLSDQWRVSENITYSRRASAHGAWSIGYIGAFLAFSEFDDVRTHAFSAGYSHQIAPDLRVQVTGGPSYVQAEDSAKSYTGYNTSASVEKVLKTNNKFSLYYQYVSGDSSGLGSVSNTRNAGFNLTHLIAGATTVFMDFSAFDSIGKLGNPYNARGVSAALSLGMPLTSTLSINAGGQYQRYDQTSLFGFEQKRAFISLRYNATDLWRFSR